MSDTAAIDSLQGSLEFVGTGGRTHLEADSREGTRETVEYPLDSLRVQNDSVVFGFAPVGYVLRGACVTSDSISGVFAVPNPSFGLNRGGWTMRRK